MTDEEKKIQREQELQDIRTVMATDAGKRMIWRMLDQGNVYRNCFTGNSNTYYLEGKRELTLSWMRDIIEACPEDFQRISIAFMREEINKAK